MFGPVGFSANRDPMELGREINFWAAQPALLADIPRKYDSTHNGPIARIPEKLQCLIIDLLGISSLGRLACTSKYFNWCASDPVFWKPIAARLTPMPFDASQNDKTVNFKAIVYKYFFWQLSNEEKSLLATIEKNPAFINASGFSANFINAYLLLQKGQSNQFTQIPSKMLTSITSYANDALEHLKQCLEENSTASNIIRIYLQRTAKTIFQCPGEQRTMTGKQLADGLTELLNKTKLRIEESSKL